MTSALVAAGACYTYVLPVLLQAALADIPRQAEAAEQRAAWEADITNYVIVSVRTQHAAGDVMRQPY
jgi:hypothetical protein